MRPSVADIKKEVGRLKRFYEKNDDIEMVGKRSLKYLNGYRTYLINTKKMLNIEALASK